MNKTRAHLKWIRSCHYCCVPSTSSIIIQTSHIRVPWVAGRLDSSAPQVASLSYMLQCAAWSPHHSSAPAWWWPWCPSRDICSSTVCWHFICHTLLSNSLYTHFSLLLSHRSPHEDRFQVRSFIQHRAVLHGTRVFILLFPHWLSGGWVWESKHINAMRLVSGPRQGTVFLRGVVPELVWAVWSYKFWHWWFMFTIFREGIILH